MTMQITAIFDFV